MLYFEIQFQELNEWVLRQETSKEPITVSMKELKGLTESIRETTIHFVRKEPTGFIRIIVDGKERLAKIESKDKRPPELQYDRDNMIVWIFPPPHDPEY